MRRIIGAILASFMLALVIMVASPPQKINAMVKVDEISSTAIMIMSKSCEVEFRKEAGPTHLGNAFVSSGISVAVHDRASPISIGKKIGLNDQVTNYAISTSFDNTRDRHGQDAIQKKFDGFHVLSGYVARGATQENVLCGISNGYVTGSR